MRAAWIDRLLGGQNAANAFAIQRGIGAILERALAHNAEPDDIAHFGGETIRLIVGAWKCNRRRCLGRFRVDRCEALRESANIGIDTVATIVNDLITMGSPISPASIRRFASTNSG